MTIYCDCEWYLERLCENVAKHGVGDSGHKFIIGLGGGGHHEAAEAVQGGHAHPALRGQIWVHERRGEYVGVSDQYDEDIVDD